MISALNTLKCKCHLDFFLALNLESKGEETSSIIQKIAMITKISFQERLICDLTANNGKIDSGI